MVTFDSRCISPGDVFICLPGAEAYVEEAKRRGASEVLPMTREEMAVYVHDYFGRPSDQLVVVGVTDTNGKTTVTSLVHQALVVLGKKSMLLGTINSQLTTPESLDIQRMMAEHLAKGGTHFVMEVSSHGIAQHRVDCIAFDAKHLTNISQDHLDFHGSMEAYRAVKESFVGDDDVPKVESLWFSHGLKGTFNDENMRSAAGILRKLGFSDDDIEKGLSQAEAPRGRFESIENDRELTIIVDYAHTPDALERVLNEASQLGPVITVFGCGGDRDKGKRPLMAKAAETYSKTVIMTADNPRYEQVEAIFEDMLEGVSKRDQIHVISDRREAIETAISLASRGDVIVVAGKGHEAEQIVGDDCISFDDGVVIREVLEA